MLVSKPTHGGGAPLGIDLDAGIATIKITRPAPAAEDISAPDTDATEPAGESASGDAGEDGHDAT